MSRARMTVTIEFTMVGNKDPVKELRDADKHGQFWEFLERPDITIVYHEVREVETE